MTVVANFFGKIVKAIPVLVAKVGTVLLLIFTIGMAFGYALALGAITPTIFPYSDSCNGSNVVQA